MTLKSILQLEPDKQKQTFAALSAPKQEAIYTEYKQAIRKLADFYGNILNMYNFHKLRFCAPKPKAESIRMTQVPKK